MGRLFLKHVKYSGDKWFYNSPIFDTGINIVEGKNKSGKSTLIAMICYCLGDYVQQFESKVNFHQQIKEDTNNFIEIVIEIDENEYTLRRFINQNYILIYEEELSLPVFRSQDKPEIFSDWLLRKLHIVPVEIYQGKYQGKINFSDLLRLIHYDQLTSPSLIYKKAKNEGNFVTDSLIIRKAIFEILIGEGVIDFYQALNDLTISSINYKEKKTLKELAEKTLTSVYNIKLNTNLSEELKAVATSLEEKRRKQEQLINEGYTQDDFENELTLLRKEMVDTESELLKCKIRIRDLNVEVNNISVLLTNRKIEVDHISKIIFTNRELNLFSPNTCPYCFNKVEREKGHCICGAGIDESSYERYFYSTEEYVQIYEKKKRTLSIISESFEDAKKELENEYIRHKALCLKKKNMRLKTKELKIDAIIHVNSTGIKRIAEEIADLESQQTDLNNKLVIYNEYISKNQDYLMAKKDYTAKDNKYQEEEDKLKEKISTMIEKFNTIYNNDFTNIVRGCEKAEINEDYMPIIDDGRYINASTEVTKRLIYYITLLKLSVTSKVNFPKFLIIDTAESLGIDTDNLNSILQLLKIDTNVKYQVILTTGINKYPASFKKYQKIYMPDEHSLLIKRVSN